MGKAQPYAGEEFEIMVKFFGVIPLRWRGVWREVDCPLLLVDEALQGPFTYWRHHHKFEPLGPGRTRLIDDVHYQFPGSWLGKWFGETFGRLQFYVMFWDRHARTRRWMRDHS